MKRLIFGFLLFGLFSGIVSAVPVSAQICDNTLPPRLIIGEQARITPGPPNVVRTQPGTSGNWVGEIPGGEYINVLDGPVCGSGYYWWLVQYGEIQGWTAESGNGEYWIDPLNFIPTATVPFTSTPRPTATPTHTFTPSFTPSITYTPTITATPSATATLVPLQQTAQAIGVRLSAERNREWFVRTHTFGDVEMVLVPAGCYDRGITDAQLETLINTCEMTSAGETSNCDVSMYDEERISGEVCFAEPFWIDRYEVSYLQYETVGAGGDPEHPWQYVRWGDDFPRGWIDVYDALDHCEARDARLPSDVEWEYAARGPESWIYPWGDSFGSVYIRYLDNIEYFTNTDGSTIPIPLEVDAQTNDISWVGAFNMAGNVSEFVYSEPSSEVSIISQRGGRITDFATELRLTRSPDAGAVALDLFTGFRCARDFEISDLSNSD